MGALALVLRLNKDNNKKTKIKKKTLKANKRAQKDNIKANRKD
jgi:hypothetical protein